MRIIKPLLFRFTAIILLAVSSGFVVFPDSTIYSADKTFIKSPTPVSDNCLLMMASDDREGLDEDGVIGIQFPMMYTSEGFFVFPQKTVYSSLTHAILYHHKDDVYLVNMQLQI